MAEERISHDKLIEPKVFQPTIDQAELLLAKIREMITGFKLLATVTGKRIPLADPKTINEVEALNKELEKLNRIEKGLEDVMKQRYIIQEKLRQAQAKARDEAKASISPYAALNKQYKEAAQRAKDLAAAHGIESKAAKAAADQALALNNKLKAIDASIGNYQRNVGNYSGALTKLTKGFGGLVGVTSVVGRALGFNTEALDRLRDASKELIHIAKDFQNAQKAGKIATQGATAATQAQTFVQYESALATEAATTATVVQEAAVKKATIVQRIWNTVMSFNPYIAAAIALGLLIAAIYQFITAETEAERATRKLNEALEFQAHQTQRNIDGYKRELEILRRQNETRLKQTEANGATEGELHEQRKKDMQEELALIDKLIIQQSNLENTNADKLKNTPGLTDKSTEEQIKAYVALQDSVEAAQEAIKDLEDERDKITADSSLSDKTFEDEQNKKAKAARDKADKEYAQLIKDKFDKETAAIDDLVKYEEAKLKDQHDKELIDDIQYEQRLYDLRVNALGVQYARGIIMRGAYLLQIKQLEEAHTKFLQDEYLKRVDEDSKKADDDYNKLKAANAKERELRKLEFEVRISEANGNKKEIAKIKREQYASDQKDLELALLGNEITEEEFNLRMRALKQKEAEFEQGLIDDTNAKRLKAAQQLEDEIFNALAERIEKEKKINADKISDLDKQIDTQTQLAIAGEANTLGFLQRERAKALEEKAKLEKKERKRKEAEQLADIFLEFYKVYASEKGGGFAAAAKATAQTLIAKGLAQAIAGAFAEGVENLQGKGTETSDSNIALLSKGESVITAKATRETAGLATALNEKGITGAKEWMLSNIQIPRVHSNDNVNDAMVSMLYKEMSELKTIIKNKKELVVSRNVLGELIIDEKEKGIHTQTIQKKTPIIPKRRYLSGR